MGRKSKQTGGNLPLTNFERTKKFKESSFETVASISQYQLGQCALTTQNLLSCDAVVCSPSGYLYDEAALLEYLLRNTKELKRQKAEQVAHVQQNAASLQSMESRKRIQDFADSQAMVMVQKKCKINVKDNNINDSAKALTDVSYWLDTPEIGDHREELLLPLTVPLQGDGRPGSPTTGNPVRRKDFWKVSLRQNQHHQLVCALSDKPILQMSEAIAYWTTSSDTGIVALESIWDQLTATTSTAPTTADRSGSATTTRKRKKKKRKCPLTDEPIQYVRPLVGSQSTSVQRHRTI